MENITPEPDKDAAQFFLFLDPRSETFPPWFWEGRSERGGVRLALIPLILTLDQILFEKMFDQFCVKSHGLEVSRGEYKIVKIDFL